MSSSLHPALQALQNARRALQQGDRSAARFWAQQAATLAPESEDPWLILAVVASPRASIAYLKRALQINPTSPRARAGMSWAIRRARASYIPSQKEPATPQPTTASTHRLARTVFLYGAFAALLLVLSLGTWFALPRLLPERAGEIKSTSVQALLVTGKSHASAAPFSPLSPTATSAPSPSPTASPFPNATPTALPSEVPTATLTETPTQPPVPTTKPPTPEEKASERPAGIGADERWVDVDLSAQRLRAYQGDQLLQKFLVSTGMKLTPTVTGQYHVYVKYRHADMYGPGYYLPAVPFVMYFYKDYGLHGTYWHHNFGTPMSHGCVNLRTEDAAWLYRWASIGTLVNIHR
jgi:lipoprotein-anchoring transpeptidase ErfK/SrfK